MLAGAALAVVTSAASAKELKSVGLTLGTLGNPFFVAVAKGAEAKAKEINPNVKVTATSADYDLNKQFTQMDNFIASGVDLILLNAADSTGDPPRRSSGRRQAGIVVVAVDVAAKGADATVQTNNVRPASWPASTWPRSSAARGMSSFMNGPAGLGGDRPGQRLQGGPGEAPGDQDPVRRPERQGHSRRRPRGDAGPPDRVSQTSPGCSRSTTRRRSDPTSRPSSSTARTLVITSVDGAPDIEEALKGESPDRGRVVEPGPLRDGAAGGRDRLRHHEGEEA